jgi:hypothetical protein
LGWKKAGKFKLAELADFNEVLIDGKYDG